MVRLLYEAVPDPTGKVPPEATALTAATTYGAIAN
jgi:hypothetical protein